MGTDIASNLRLQEATLKKVCMSNGNIATMKND